MSQIEKYSWFKKYSWLFGCGFMYVACALLYVLRPPNPDQIAFDYMGWRQLAGEAPYHGFLNMDWPGIIWLHSLSIWVFGLNIWSWRILDFILATLGAAFMADFLRRSVDRTAALTYLLIFPIIYIGLPYWIPGNHDTAATHFVCGALWFHQLALAKKQVRFQWGSGALLGIAVLCKPTFVFVAAFLVLQTVAIRLPLRKAMGHTVNAAAAAVMVVLLGLLAIVAQGVALHEIWECTVQYNTTFVRSNLIGMNEQPIATLIGYGARLHARWWPLLTLGGILGSIIIIRRKLIHAKSLLALWLAGWAAFLAQQKTSEYHLAPCIVALIGLLSITISQASGVSFLTNRRWARWLRVVGLGAIFLVSGHKVYSYYAPLLRSGYTHFLTTQKDGNTNIAESLALAAQLERMTSADDFVFVFGYSSSLNVFARRSHPTALFYPDTMFKLPYLPFGPRWTEEWKAALERRRPKLCIIQADFEDWVEGQDPAPRFLHGFLSSHYDRIGFWGPSGTYILYQLVR